MMTGMITLILIGLLRGVRTQRVLVLENLSFARTSSDSVDDDRRSRERPRNARRTWTGVEAGQSGVWTGIASDLTAGSSPGVTAGGG